MAHLFLSLAQTDFRRWFALPMLAALIASLLGACQSAPSQSLTGVSASEFDGGRYLRMVKDGVTHWQVDAPDEAGCQILRGNLSGNAKSMMGCSSRSTAQQMPWTNTMRATDFRGEVKMHYVSESLCKTLLQHPKANSANIKTSACQKKSA